MKLWVSLCIVFIIFTGCSSKNIQQPEKTPIVETQIDEEDEELFDEFEEEMEEKKISDPFGGYNRVMTEFNDSLYINVLIPVAKGYRAVVHTEIRKSVSNFFNNLYFPVRVVNNLLQGKFENASEETGRFVVNTTIGILGLFDPAKSQFKLEAHNEDFGQTLGFYGVEAGPHIVLPIFGPSNLRDSLSIFPDSSLSPIDYTDREWFTITDTWAELILVKSYERTNDFSLNINGYEKLKQDSIDLYPYLRDLYEQYRAKQIKE